ncbi:MAG TPA: hypothetical protein VF432_08310 [Thermoanaerobaculia bacterium]
MVRRLSVLFLLALTACTASLPPRDVDERDDDPDRAAEYRALKHAGSDDPFASLTAAREAMRAMPSYSTTDNVWIESSSRQVDESTSLDDSSTGRLEDSPGPLGKWRFLGPGNIGGRTRVLLVDSNDPNLMYTGGVSGGIWKSTSAGAKWEPIGDDLANIAVNSMAMDPRDHNVIYAGTGEGFFREEVRGTALPLRGDGIFATRDAGETWTRITPAGSPDFHWVNDLVVSAHDSSRIYAATRTGVWRTADSGATWTRVLDPKVTGGCLELAYRGDTSGDYLFASCGTFQRATVYRAKNAEGSTPWEAVLSEENMGRTSLAIAPSDPSIVYAMAASNEEGNYNQGLLGVYRSSSNGDAGSWEPRLTNDSPDLVQTFLLSNPLTASGDICATAREWIGMGWYCNTLAVDPVDPNRVWAGGVDLFRSDDGGKSFGVASYWWGGVNDPSYAHADQHAIVFHPRYDGSSNKTVFFTNDGGIFRTENALAEPATDPKAPCNPVKSKMVFTTLNNNYGVTQFYHGAVSADGMTFLGGTQDNGTLLGTVDAGPDAWLHVLGGDGGYVAIDQEQPRYMYGESQWGYMARSTNGGEGWRRMAADLRGAEFLFVAPFVMDPKSETRRLWLGGRMMWVTTDRAENWRPASTPFPALISAVAVHPTDNELVIAGTAGGHIARNTAATSATELTAWPLTQPREGFVSSLAFDPTDPTTIYATYAGFGGEHVWVSGDSGVTWTPRSGNLPDLPVHAIAVDPIHRDRLYLGTDLGVFVSLDRGLTWAVENTGFANAVTESLFVAQGASGPAVYAFTHGRGAWRAELVFPTLPKRRRVRH